MSRILLNTDQLRQLSQRLLDSADELRQLDSRLANLMDSLDMSVRQQANLDAQVGEMRSRASDLSNQAEASSHTLLNKTQAFEDADRESAQQIPEAPPKLDLAGIGKDAPDASKDP